MCRLGLVLVLVIVISANLHGNELTFDGQKCLSEAEELTLEAVCSNADEDSSECVAAFGWHFDSGRLRRAECDLAFENKRLELALVAVRSAVDKIDKAEMTEDGHYPTGYPIRKLFDDAQDAWLEYISLHCEESAGPRGAGLAWHAYETECKIPFVRQRIEYLMQHWVLNAPR